MENTIRTDERIFRVFTHDDQFKLVNLSGFKIADSGELLLSNGDPVHSVRHLWNWRFEPIDKAQVKTMFQSHYPTQK